MEQENNKKSCVILFEYGATLSHINTIMRSPYSLEELKQDPGKIVEIFGENRSKKIGKIIQEVDDVNRKSIYELLNYGLSKGMVDEIFEKNITIEMLEKIDYEQLHNNYHIGKFSCRKIYEALGLLNNVNYFKKENNYTDAIEKIILNYDKKEITINELLKNEEIRNMELSQDEINEDLKELDEKNYIKLDLDKIIIRHETLSEAIENHIKIEDRKKVLIGIFKGAKQVDYAEKMGKTRERIRQIYNRALSSLPKVLEEDIIFKEIFCKYNIERELFVELFGVDEIVYGYLEEKYNKGEDSITDLLGIDYFDEKEEKIIKKWNKLITYNGLLIKEEKMQLLLAILQTEGIQYNIFELIEKYNEAIEENKFNIEKIENVHNIESVLGRQKNIIASNKRRYRYYNYDLLTQEDISELKEVLDVDDGAYYTDYFFDNNQDLMDRINILEKNELYNLMKKLFSNEPNIEFTNMPIVLIGYKTKDEFLEEKIKNLAPISVDDFVEKMNEEYGHTMDSLKAYIAKTYYSYITNGIINIETKKFDDSDIEKIKEKLTKNIYSLKEIKEILFELFKKDCSEYVNTSNFEKINFKIRDKYMFRSDVGASDEIIRKEILSENIFNYNETRLKSVGSTFGVEFYELISKNKLIKYDDGLYYTTKELQQRNINIERIEEFKKEIFENVENEEIFTIYNIREMRNM